MTRYSCKLKIKDSRVTNGNFALCISCFSWRYGFESFVLKEIGDEYNLLNYYEKGGSKGRDVVSLLKHEVSKVRKINCDTNLNYILKGNNKLTVII